MKIPSNLDGANILYYTANDSSQSYGVTYYQDEDRRENITALAICQYAEHPDQIYLFACNSWTSAVNFVDTSPMQANP